MRKMNYLSAFLWPKFKEGWIHLTPDSNVIFIGLSSVSQNSVSKELDAMGRFVQGPKLLSGKAGPAWLQMHTPSKTHNTNCDIFPVGRHQ